MNRVKFVKGILTLMALMVIPTNSRHLNEGDALLPPNTDNIEIHHVKMVDGVMHEDHPVIMYKEDFVNEDYDPKKNHTKTVKHKKRRHNHHHRLAEKEESIPFDTLPDNPIIIDDVAPPKEEWLQKHPKKYHSRSRRQAIPWARSTYYSTPYQSVFYQPPSPYYPAQANNPYQRFPVAGKPPKKTGKLPYWQERTGTTEAVPDSLDNRLGVDVSNPLHHNSNPADADFSVFDNIRPPTNEIAEASRRPPATSSPAWSPKPEEEARPVWGSSSPRRPNSVSAGNRVPGRPFQPPTTTRRPPIVTSSPVISNCVWAIVNCCSRGSAKIRYACFEDFGCHGAFWDVNPCADETIREVGDGLFGFGRGKAAEEEDLPQAPQPVFAAAASAPQARAPPAPRQEDAALQFPEDSGHRAGSSCQRAAAFCCQLRSQLATLYDCYAGLRCEQTLSNIIADCS